MPFTTRLPFTDRQVVQISGTSITLSGQTHYNSTGQSVIDPTVLYEEPQFPLTGITSGQTTVTLGGLTGYMYPSNFRGDGAGLVIKPPILNLSGSTGTTTQNVTGFVLQSTTPHGSVEWAPISGVSWSVSACTSPLYVTTIEACPSSAGTITISAGELHVDGDIKITDGTQQAGYVLTTDASGVGTWQYNSTGFSGNTEATCISELWVSTISGCSPVTIGSSIQSSTSSATGATSFAYGLNTKAHGDYSHAEGGSTTASGDYSHVRGYGSTASGNYSTASGYGSTSNGIISNSEGFYTVAGPGIGAHSEGYNSVASGNYSHAEGGPTDESLPSSSTIGSLASGVGSHAQNIRTTASGYGSHAGGYVSIASGSTSFIHSSGSTVIGDNSAVLGGSNITGDTNDTVYVPNLNVREDYILHSDSVLEISNISNISSDFKGSYTEFDWTGITSNVISNNNPEGSAGILIGEFSDYPSTKNHGFLTYYGSGYTRSGSPTTGTDFYRNKFVLKGSDDVDGMVINPVNNDSSGTLWWEIDGNSIMILKGDGGTSGNLGIALKEDGTEMPTANLQIGGTGTTGTFKYIDGNQQNGYVLTSDANGVGTWQYNSTGFSGNTSGSCISDIHVSNIHSCSPLNINPLDEGNVYFGSTSGVTIDVINKRLGVGTSNPSYPLEIFGPTNEKISFIDSSTAPHFHISGSPTQMIRFIATEGTSGIGIGVRGELESTFTNYGEPGDTHIRGGANSHGLNIIEASSATHDDYIRFYAGQAANTGNTPDIHIQGSGATRGYVGINTKTPTEKLHIVDGSTKIEYDNNGDTGLFITNLNNGANARSLIALNAAGEGIECGAILQLAGTGYTSSGTFTGPYIPNSFNITTSGGNINNRPHINIGTRRVDGETRFFNGGDAFNSTTLLGIFYTSGLTITDMVNTDTLRVRDGATAGYVLTSDTDGVATWQDSSGGVSIDPYNDVGSATTITWNVSGSSTNYEATLTGNTTLNVSNVRNGDYGTLIVHQDGVGSRTLTFGTGTNKVVNVGGGAPTLTATAGATDILSFTYNGTIFYWTVGNDYT